MHSAFSRLFTFYMLLLTFNLILFAGVSTISVRYLMHSILEKEEESDIIKIQMALKGYGEEWTFESIPENQYTFFLDNILSVVSFIRIYDRDYNVLKEKGVVPPGMDEKRLSRQGRKLHPLGIEGIDPAYIEVLSSPDKLIEKPSLIQIIKQSMYLILLILLITFPLIVGAAYLGSRKLTVNIGKISDTIAQLADGKRDVQFPEARISESQQIVKAAENLQRQLILKDERANHRLQELTHDLKGPITGLYNQLEAVELGAMELSEERFNHFYRELGYLNQLIDDMSVLYKLEDTLGSHNCQALQTERDLITPLLDRFLPLAEEKGIVIYTDIERKEIWGDPILLMRGVSNLIQNAILYGTGLAIDISIFTDEETGFDTIEVRNKGQIAKEDLPLIFTRYWRKTQDRGGSGLGLSITRMIARKHGGDLTVRNQIPDQVVFGLSINAIKKERLLQSIS